jgi:type IV secretion system protein VirB5
MFQMAALAWFKPLRLFWPFRVPTTYRSTLESLTPYQKAISMWAERLTSARRQTRNWRFAALGSASLCAMLAVALATSAGRAELTPYVIQVDHLNATNPSNPEISTPSDAQIAYFLARFVKNTRSSSTDPVVVRSNWIEALNYVTDGGARTLSEYAQDANPFRQIGLQPVEVELLYVIRASDSSFEIHWKEKAYEAGTLMRTDTFTGTAEIVLNSVASADPSRNPLGLYVHAFRWARDTAR